ncbi:MAG TPA: nitroreductase [Phenylobacterium sp.]|nr:nitroreductase [Phenylobacterium sp.]
MDVLEAIHDRRAVRDYLDEPVGRDLIAAVIDCAVWAPSGMNRQPWRFHVLEGRADLAQCSEHAKALMLEQAKTRPELAAVRGMLEQPQFNIFYNAPALIVVCATTDDEMAAKDCCLAAQNLMLSAHAHGLGTCWIGFSEAWLNSPDGRTRLGMEEGTRAVAPIIIGRPAARPGPPDRRVPDIRYVTTGPASG